MEINRKLDIHLLMISSAVVIELRSLPNSWKSIHVRISYRIHVVIHGRVGV